MSDQARPVSGGGRPKGGYKLADGSRVPGVTTIVGRWKDAGGLIRWAYNCGLDGIDIDKAREGAASTGTMAHELVEAAIHGRQAELPTPVELGVTLEEWGRMTDGANQCLKAFQDWRAFVDLRIIETETPLVHPYLRFGGTLDAVATVNGQLVLLDWKTSSGIYPEYLCQLGGYAILYEELLAQTLHGAHLLRFGKEFGDFHHHHWPRPVLELGMTAFRLQLEMYELDQKLKRAVR